MTTPLPDQIARPDFAIVVRGYDRAQVDAYFGRVLEWLADADNRAAVAERERDQFSHEVAELRTTVMMLEEKAGMPVPQSMSAFSERIGQMMQTALEAAHDLQEQAEQEARARRATLMTEAERLLDEAKEEAAGILEQARGAERAIEDHIADLRGARDDALAQLGVLHEQLAAVLAMPEPAAEEPVARAGDADETLDQDDTGLELDDLDASRDGVADPGPSPDGVAGVGDTEAPTGQQPAVDVPEAEMPTMVQPAVGRGRNGAR